MSFFGGKLKQLREEKGETQEDIAKLLKISRAAVSKYESGDREPDIETIKTLASHFKVTVDYIFGLTDIMRIPGKVREDSGVYEQMVRAEIASVGIQRNCDSPVDIDLIMKDSRFVRLAFTIRENNIDLDVLENLIRNIMIITKNQKHP